LVSPSASFRERAAAACARLQNPWAIALAALVIRLVYLWLHDAPTIVHDAIGYHSVAENVTAGDGYTLDEEPYVSREPGYILAVALVYLIGGADPVLVQIVQAFIGAAACGITYLLTNRVAGRAAAAVAGLLLAVAPAFLGYTDHVLTEVAATAWFALSLLLLLKTVQEPSWPITIAVGVVLGVTTLTRANFLAFILMAPLLIWIGGQGWRSALRHGLPATAVALLVMTPWVIRNAVEFDAFIPTRLGIGEMLYTGSDIEGNGFYPDGGVMGDYTSRGISPVEADRLLTRKAIDNIADDPLGVAWLYLEKGARTWLISDSPAYQHLEDVDTNEQNAFEVLRTVGPLSAIVLLFHEAFWVACLLLATFAIIAKRRERSIRFLAAAVAVSVVALLPGNPIPRYQVPSYPAVFALAAIGAIDLVNLVGRRLRRGAEVSRPASP
jgi:4-amino-4-deoxy-L-arabinose transferase-like glycosyltransferase